MTRARRRSRRPEEGADRKPEARGDGTRKAETLAPEIGSPAPDAPPLTPAVFHVLLALADGPLHGYAIMKAVAESAGPGLAMGPGTIYGSLQRMEEAGLVAEVPRDEGERRRRFAMLPAGRRALAAEVARLTRLANLVRARNLLRWETE